MRGRVCAIQQSSIFIRVSIARLINEVRACDVVRAAPGPVAAAGRAWCGRSSSSASAARRSASATTSSCVSTCWPSLGGFPTSGATEDSTLGYALGARGVLIGALPMVELVDLPETTDKLVRQNARWYKGVLDDVRFLVRQWRAAPTAFNFAQLARHVGNKVIEWPIAAVVYPGGRLHRLAPGLPVLRSPACCSSSASRSRRSRWGSRSGWAASSPRT